MKILLIVILISVCSSAFAFTLSFDNLVPISDPDYHFGSNIVLFNNFEVADHSNSTWGPPHSGNNVLVSDDVSSFDIKGPIYPVEMYYVGMYVSTNINSVETINFYQYLVGEDPPLATITFGAPVESWTNQYIYYESAIPFTNVTFLPTNDSNLIGNFCIDDLTIIPVPEPSSIAILAAGLLPVGMGLLRRRTRRS